MQRRTVIAGLAAIPAIASLPVGFSGQAMAAMAESDTLDTSAGPVTIQPIHHASLVLSFGDQVIYIDPAQADFSGQPAPTAILITHAHGDHFDPETLARIGGDAPILTTEEVAGKMSDELKARATTIANGESTAFGGVPVAAVAAYNTTADRQQYHPKGIGNGYVLTFGDKKVYVAGDTEPTDEMLALSGIEVAFLPMNLPYTMTVEQAADAVKAFKPAVVYPYHSRGSDTEQFAQLVGDAAEVRIRDWYGEG